MLTNYLYERIPDTDIDTNIKIDESTQTDFIDYTSFQILPKQRDEVTFNNFEKDHYFNHLKFANQSYFEHFKDSIFYCGVSLKSAFYFFCHAIWPDSFQQNGSQSIHNLSSIIHDKYQKRIQELHRIN